MAVALHLFFSVTLHAVLGNSYETIPTTYNNREQTIHHPPTQHIKRKNEEDDRRKVGDAKFRWFTTSVIRGADADHTAGELSHTVRPAGMITSKPDEMPTPLTSYRSDATVPDFLHSHLIQKSVDPKGLPIGVRPCPTQLYQEMSPPPIGTRRPPSMPVSDFSEGGGPPAWSVSYPPHPPDLNGAWGPPAWPVSYPPHPPDVNGMTTIAQDSFFVTDNPRPFTHFPKPLYPPSWGPPLVTENEIWSSGISVSHPAGQTTDAYDPCYPNPDSDSTTSTYERLPSDAQAKTFPPIYFDKGLEYYCDIENTQNITSLHSCPSCRNRCSDVNSLSQKEGLCSCDRACLIYRDCCPDFHSECSEFTEALTVRDAVPGSPISLCRGIAFESIQYRFGYLFINSCPYESDECYKTPTIKQDFHQILIDSPVMDVSTGVFYTNYKCAQCNGAKSIKPLQPILKYHRDDIEKLRTEKYAFPIFAKDISPHDIAYRLPDVLPRRCVHHVTDRCYQCPESTIGKMCEHGPLLYTTILWPPIAETFKNFHCALCTSIKAGVLVCGHIVQQYHFPDIEVSALSLSVSFDFTKAGDLQFGKIQVRCNDQREPLPDGLTCGKPICPSGLILQGDFCVNNGSQYINKLEIRYHINSSNCLDNITWFDDVELETTIFEEFQIITAPRGGKLEVTNVSLKKANDSICLFDICVYIEYGDTATAQDSLKAIRQQGSSLITTALYDIAKQSDLPLMTFTTFYTSLHWINAELPPICKGYRVDSSAYVIRNKTLILLSNGKRYSSNEYILQGASAIICIHIETHLGNDYMLSDKVGMLTIVLSTLSVVCLLIRLVLQPIQSRYHTAAGRMQCHLAAAICLATTLLLVSPLAAHIGRVCFAMGVAKYSAFLAAFFWMACVAGDTWWALQNAQLCVRSDTNRSLTKFHLVTWGMSICMATTVYVFDQSDTSSSFKPNIGGISCWITQKYALIVFFIVPVFFSIKLSAIFFVLSVLSLKQHIKQSGLVSHMDTLNETMAYVKLFVLLGLTWSVAFVAVWVDNVAVWYLFVTSNGAQGIWLFVAFVLEWSKIRKLIRSCRGHVKD